MHNLIIQIHMYYLILIINTINYTHTLYLDQNMPKLRDLMRLKINDWYNVGLQLELEEEALDKIEKSYHDSSTRRRKMFTLWQHSVADPSYHTLVTALLQANEEEVASNICTQHGKYINTPWYSTYRYSLYV